jgi:hypothetical protein
MNIARLKLTVSEGLHSSGPVRQRVIQANLVRIEMHFLQCRSSQDYGVKFAT